MKSNYLANALLDHEFGKTEYAMPTHLYVALCTATPVKSSTGSTISQVNYTGYSRVDAVPGDWNAAAARLIDNLNPITFPPCTAGESTAKAFAICSAASGGNLLRYGPLGNYVGRAVVLASDIFYLPNHGLSNSDAVILFGESLPGGVSQDTRYYVVNSSEDTFKLEPSIGGGAIDLTSDGVAEIFKYGWLAISQGITPLFAAGELNLIEE